MAGRDHQRDGEVRVLALACGLAGLVAGVTALVPFSPTAPRGAAVVVLAVGLALCAALRRAGPRTPPRTRHAVLALATSLVTACVALSTTDAGTAVTSVAYVWIGVFSATFHTPRALAGHLVAIVAGLALGLVATGAPSPAQTWFFVAATTVGVSVVLHRTVAQLRRHAVRDPLTDVLTRRAFRAAAEEAMARAERHGRPLALALLDLDDFKRVNDTLGHAAGDALLTNLAAAWGRALRSGDLLGRFGGDEFLLLLPGADADQAAGALARLRAATTSAATTTWSAGVAVWQGEDFDAWLGRADRDLYASKPAGGASGTSRDAPLRPIGAAIRTK